MAKVATPDHGPATTADQIFWRAATYNEPYWDEYMAARPKYSSEFYDRIIEYYKAHTTPPSKQSVAHDVGTGPGQVAAELCKYFDKVIASDPNETHLAVAAARNEKAGLNDKITWTKVAAENLDSHHPAGSATFVAAAECMALLDPTQALKTFAHLLQPSGTLAVWFYGRPFFSESALASTCQPILDEIIDLTVEKVVKGGSAAHKATWKRATDTVESFLDNVAYPAETWDNVYRHKWNPHLPMTVIGPNACDFPIEPWSSVDETREKVVEEKDPHFWGDSWNVREVRRYVEFLLPNVEELKAKGLLDHIEVKYQELEKAMGGPDVKREITWSAVLILATRK